MFEALLIKLALSKPFPSIFGEFPKNLPSPMVETKEDDITVKVWIVTEPNCIVRTYTTPEGPLVTEVTILDPESTKAKSVVDLISSIEGIDSEEKIQTFYGMDEDGCTMKTATNSGHLLLWERDPKTKAINKVTILYRRPSLQS